MKKRIAVMTLILMFGFSVSALAGEYSRYWKQDALGVWHIYNTKGEMLTDCWLCDDAVAANGNNVWYLIDAEGDMVSAPLVQDGTGNYYSLETEHNGNFGMLRYKSGLYGAVYLELESAHNGSFAAIKNTEGLTAMKAIYGVTKVDIDNDSCVYTSHIDDFVIEQTVSKKSTKKKVPADDDTFYDPEEEETDEEGGGDGPGSGSSSAERKSYEETGNRDVDSKLRPSSGGKETVSSLGGRWYSYEDPSIVLKVSGDSAVMTGGTEDEYDGIEYVKGRTDGGALFMTGDGTYIIYYDPDTLCIVTSKLDDPDSEEIEVMTFYNDPSLCIQPR